MADGGLFEELSAFLDLARMLLKIFKRRFYK
jgi:hypothetical protein